MPPTSFSHHPCCAAAPHAETNLQHGYYIVLGFIKIILVAVVFQKVHKFMGQLGQDEENLRARIRDLNSFMTSRNLPKRLQHRVRTYFLHCWSLKGAFEKDDLSEALPCNLRNEVLMYTRGAVLAKVPIFNGCNPGFREQLGRRLKARVYAPGDTVVEWGEQGDEMFFLNRVGN